MENEHWRDAGPTLTQRNGANRAAQGFYQLAIQAAIDHQLAIERDADYWTAIQRMTADAFGMAAAERMLQEVKDYLAKAAARQAA